MNSRRMFLKSPMVPIAAVGAYAATKALAASNSQQMLVVGPGGNFDTVAEAIESIADNNRNTPYLIKVLPGIYPLAWKVKEWITVEGSGPLSTIFEGDSNDSIQVAGSNIHLQNFGVRFTGSDHSQAAIRRKGFATAVYLNNIHIEHFGPGAAISNRGHDTRLTWWLNALKIRTEGTGLDIASHTYCDNLKIFMFGTNSGHDHIGCRVADSRSRIYLNNCRIGTGYGYGYDGEIVKNEVHGDNHVVAIWLPANSDKTRVEVHGLESFIRNESSSNPFVNINVIRIESGWVRAFGCFGQAESPGLWDLSSSLFQSSPGKVEQYACRFTDATGNSFGSSIEGVRTFSAINDGYVFDKFEAGLHRLIGGDGSFELKLRPGNGIMPGEKHTFKKIDSVGQVAINPNGNTLEGRSENIVLTASYDTLKIIWDGDEWLRF